MFRAHVYGQKTGRDAPRTGGGRRVGPALKAHVLPQQHDLFEPHDLSDPADPFRGGRHENRTARGEKDLPLSFFIFSEREVESALPLDKTN